MLESIWRYHVHTQFFMPYPSVADKLVSSIFARDFQGSSAATAANTDALEAIISTAAAPCNPTFDEVIDHTRRVCVQACSQSIPLFLLPISIPMPLHRSQCLAQVPSHLVSTRPFNLQFLPRSRSLQQLHAHGASAGGSRGGIAVAWCGASSPHAWEDAISQLLAS